MNSEARKLMAAKEYADERLIKYGLIDPDTLKYTNPPQGMIDYWEIHRAFVEGVKWQENQEKPIQSSYRKGLTTLKQRLMQHLNRISFCKCKTYK